MDDHKSKVAVVTGGNRGIGKEICRQLAEKGFIVVLTARDEKKGLAAVEELKSQGLDNIVFHQLDVTDGESIDRLAEWLKSQSGKIFALVNNAGIMLGGSGMDTDLDKMRETMETNVYGPLRLSQAIVPLMKSNSGGRIVNMSSGLGQLSDMGGGQPAYRLSKTGINVITRVLAAELSSFGILVNSASPGWVRTDMGGPNANLTVDKGADTAVWLASLPDGGPTGGFFKDRKRIDW